MRYTLTEFANRKDTNGLTTKPTWEELVDRLSRPVITSETFSEYMAMTNEERTAIKDIGGYVCGEFKNNQRSQANILYRNILTIDADEGKSDDVDSFEILFNYKFVCHTTHKSSPTAPRYRWLFPLTRNVNAAEYRALVSVVKHWVGADTIDESTDQPERLMFWPSVSLDSDYVFLHGGSAEIDPDEYLADIDLSQFEVTRKADKERHTEDNFVVPEGSRNKTLFSFAANLRGQGLNRNDIRAMLDVYNDAHCDPAIPDFELDTIARSVCVRYLPGEVVAPTLRDAWEDFAEYGEIVDIPKPKKEEDDETFLLADLMKEEFTEGRCIVDNVMTEGLGLLCAPPKFGKSWWALDAVISIARGDNFLGFPSHSCGVLYFALEDGKKRIKNRSGKVAGSRTIPTNVYIRTKAPLLHEGFLDKVMDELRKHPDIGLVIIDTLQKIRGTAGKTEGVYGYDYRELGDLQSFAIEHGICILCLHHLNKGGDNSDFVNRINGSTGISGAADFIIIMSKKQRGDKNGLMSVTGRDITEDNYVVEFSDYRWVNLGQEKAYEKTQDEIEHEDSPLVKTLVYLLDQEEDRQASIMDLGKEVLIELSSNQLKDEVEARYGEVYENIKCCSRDLHKQENLLSLKEGITLDTKRTKTGVRYTFRRSVV